MTIFSNCKSICCFSRWRLKLAFSVCFGELLLRWYESRSFRNDQYYCHQIDPHKMEGDTENFEIMKIYHKSLPRLENTVYLMVTFSYYWYVCGHKKALFPCHIHFYWNIFFISCQNVKKKVSVEKNMALSKKSKYPSGDFIFYFCYFLYPPDMWGYGKNIGLRQKSIFQNF